jgi:hypothetical protein
MSNTDRAACALLLNKEQLAPVWLLPAISPASSTSRLAAPSLEALHETCSLGLIATGLLPATNALGVVSDLLARAIVYS